jgi:two-component system response regulator FixJ
MPRGTVIVVDDVALIRNSVRVLLEAEQYEVKDFDTAAGFLANPPVAPNSCLLVDINMPGMNGLELQQELNRRKLAYPLIVITGYADVALAVKAMKAGAVDIIEKPFDDTVLLAAVQNAIENGRQTGIDPAEAMRATALLAKLTERERDVLRHLTLGESNKRIAEHLAISVRTVENHRAHVQSKLNAHALADLMRLARAGGLT